MFFVKFIGPTPRWAHDTRYLAAGLSGPYSQRELYRVFRRRGLFPEGRTIYDSERGLDEVDRRQVVATLVLTG